MSHAPALKAALKRGALIAAANWPLVAVQFIAEATLKLLLGVPVVGGIFLVVLLLDADVEELLRGDVREIVASVFSALRANPAALAAFALAFLVVLLGGSVLTFVVKGGTVAVLAEAETHAGPIERPPLRLADAAARQPDRHRSVSRRLPPAWRRYVRLGICLLLVYAVTAAAYLAFLFGGYALADNSACCSGGRSRGGGLERADRLDHARQLPLPADADGDRRRGRRRARGARAVVRFLRTSLREVAGIFGVVLLLVVLATAASILATAGLGLIASCRSSASPCCRCRSRRGWCAASSSNIWR